MSHLAVAMLQLLWLLLTLSLVIVSHLTPPLAAAAVSPIVSSPAPAPSSLPGCPSRCGDVGIPYPFGIGAKCAWPGDGDFTVDCNESSIPPTPRPYLGNAEVKNISVGTGEMHAFTPVAHICYNSSNTTASGGEFGWEVPEPFLISPMKNVFTAIGCYTVAFLRGKAESRNFLTGCISYCEEDFVKAAEDGQNCTGFGCCQTTSLPAKLNKIEVYWGNDTGDNPAWKYSPCSYGFVAAKDWYNFRRLDLTGRGTESFISRVGDSTVPLVFDWAITKNGSCQIGPQASAASGKPTAPACVSAHSECVNATNGDGYLCKCSEGYDGNPYISGPGGCKDIDECKNSTRNGPCSSDSTCQNREGDYICKCKSNRKGDGKSEKGCSQYIVSPYVIAVAATAVALVLACLATVLLLKRKQKKHFNKNGGKILKAQGIKIYNERELKKITKGYRKRLGGGNFGDVYKGTIDGAQRVAVKCSAAKKLAHGWKKSIRHDVRQHEQEEDVFVNEITFQFNIRHANVVQLLGCCLESDIPILVFEYISNGSLHEVLHEKTCTLSLSKRLDIAIGSAEALSYMHTRGDYNHVHGDIKPANILLDKDFMPKVSDFGSSKLLSIDSYVRAVAADKTYIDPVYYKTERFTVKSDVYSFGLVLLELIMRKTAKYDGNKSLPLDFVKCIKDEGNGRKLYDRDILNDDNAQSHVFVECLDSIGALAVLCLKEDVDERPTMAEVVEELKQVKFIAFGNSCSEAS